MPTWIDGDALMKHWDLWTWTDSKGMPHEFAYIPAPVVTRAIEAVKNSGVEMKPVIHAHWDKHFFPGSVECGLPILVDATCSNCGFKMYESYLYCPQCGCRMENGMVLDCET